MSRLGRRMHRATCRRPGSGRVGGSLPGVRGIRVSRGGVVVTAGAALLYVLSSALDPSPASAADAAIADHDRWSPAVALQMGLLRQQAHGRGESNRRPPGNQGLPADGDDLLLDYYFGLSFELMAPSIADIGGHPQPFIHVDVLHPLGLEVDIAREGSPDGFEFAEFPGLRNSTLTAAAVGGQGLKTEAEFKSPTVTVGLGLSFSFDWFDRPFRVRPSLQYFHEKVEVSGVMLDAEGQRVIEDFVVIEDFDLLSLTGAQTKTLHGLGGGVELEMEIARLKSGTLSIGAGFHLYHILGGRRFEFSETDGTDFASWSATMDPLVYRGGFGFRYRFLPN